MSTLRAVVRVAVLGAAALALGVLGLAAVARVTYGCEEKHEALAASLWEEEILHLAPADARPGDWSHWCDDDDMSLVAYQAWTHDGEPAVQAFYLRAAEADGWRRRAERDVAGRVQCYSKQVAWVTAFLSVRTPVERDGQGYRLSVWAYEDGDIGCAEQ